MDFTTLHPEKDPTVYILPFFKEGIDPLLIQKHSGIERIVDFEGKFGEILVIYHPTKPRKVFLLGLGEQKDIIKAFQAFRILAFHHHAKWTSSIHVGLEHLTVEICHHAALGLELATYNIGLFKKERESMPAFFKGLTTVYIHHADPNANNHILAGKLTAETQINMMKLVDKPSNKKKPEDLANYALESAHQYRYQAKVLNQEVLEHEGLHALLAVGQGSNNSPLLIQLEYKPSEMESAQPQLGLVGKGITFDTGGLSIKGANNMHYMKSDMGGAAAVIGAIELAARLQLDIHVVGIIPVAENSVDALSIKPGDVIDSYSGKTIEVIDTDAEGRLILADGLAYLQKNYRPNTIIDVATLTGNCVLALGYHAAGLFTDNAKLAKELVQAGQHTNERLWQLPLWDDYKGDIQSDIADVKNYSGKPVAGAIAAAKFLQFFVKDHPQWAHLDIAGVAFGDSAFTKMKSATGFGVRLLVEYMKLSENGLEYKLEGNPKSD